MFGRIRTWLIFKLIGDQPVIANIDVKLDERGYELKKTLLLKNANPV